MITSLLLTLLQGMATVISAPLQAIPLPSWMGDGTVASSFSTLRGYIWGSPAPAYLDLSFAFEAVYAWWMVKLGLIPVRWITGVFGRWLGPMVPRVRTDAGGAFIGTGATAAQRSEERSAAKAEVRKFNRAHPSGGSE